MSNIITQLVSFSNHSTTSKALSNNTFHTSGQRLHCLVCKNVARDEVNLLMDN